MSSVSPRKRASRAQGQMPRPWIGDVLNEDEMRRLVEALRALAASAAVNLRRWGLDPQELVQSEDGMARARVAAARADAAEGDS